MPLSVCPRILTQYPRRLTHAPTFGSAPRLADQPTVTLTLGPEQLVIRRRYETLSILNDFLVAAWFLVGSVLFLYPSLERVGIWLFVVGSGQFMVRPALRLAHRVHLRRVPASHWDM